MSDLPDAPAPEILRTPEGASLAYHRRDGRLPGLIFLGGFASDMTGTKARALESFAVERGQAFVRFDYQGHGQSSGAFQDGSIGQWTRDALHVLDSLTEGPQVLAGSSMGGWIMLLAALARPGRVGGLLGIAPAPDFTEDLLWPGLSPDEQAAVAREGVCFQPNPYGASLPITRHLIEEGRAHLLLREPIPLACPLRILQGMQDDEVPWRRALTLAETIQATDVEVTLIKDGDHRLSDGPDLDRLRAQTGRLLDHVEGRAT